MNVASVTVTAITQGLIEPSGIRNFDKNLSFTLRLDILSSIAVSRPLLYSRLQTKLTW
jgi:hypothetical protein